MNISLTLLLIPLSVVPALFLFLGILKIYQAKNVPGTRFFFAAVFLELISFLVPVSEEDGDSIELQLVELAVDFLPMLVFSIGFYIMSRYVYSIHSKVECGQEP